MAAYVPSRQPNFLSRGEDACRTHTLQKSYSELRAAGRGSITLFREGLLVPMNYCLIECILIYNNSKDVKSSMSLLEYIESFFLNM